MVEERSIRDIDTVFADFVCSRESGDTGILRKAALHASASTGQGNICTHLSDIFGSAEADAASGRLRTAKSVGQPGDYRPLVLDGGNRLYLHRYWKYETDLAKALLEMSSDLPEVDEELLNAGITGLFGPLTEDPDWQRVAAAAAVRSRFCVISGGPGTGKTTTVVKILALLIEQAKGSRMRIGLAAPTGKAAARLKESIRTAGAELVDLTTVAGEIPSDVSTIQRMLGVIPDSCRFRHTPENPLLYEAVVVDEASMVSLAVMAKLLAALAPGTRLILLGDRDQLASVEAGAVLGDICNTGQSYNYSERFRAFMAATTGIYLPESRTVSEPAALNDSVVVLQKNYRFEEASGIGLVSRAVRDGNVGSVLEGLQAGTVDGLTFHETPSRDELRSKLAQVVLTGYAEYLKHESPEQALIAFDRFRVLCALRQGMYGVEGMNSLIESILAGEGLIKPDQKWYRGRPVMIKVNDYGVKLFNGDIGITLDDQESESGLSVYFPLPDGTVRKISPHRLPVHETVFAMTVHKSQGSEFDSLLIVLPPTGGEILTRELVYTALTRCRKRVEIWGTAGSFLAATGKRVQRSSGLREKLWGNQG